jgi:hypothetical protein
MRAPLLALALVGAGVSLLPAQEMRDYSVARQRHGESRLNARLEFAAGSIHVVSGRDDQLYLMQLRYDPERFVPVSRYDAGTGSLTLGIENSGKAGLRVSSRAQLTQVASVALSPSVLLSLDARLGAANASLDLGGLRLADLQLESGATSATVSFSRPNLIRCSSMTMESGAGGLTLNQLGNSRCERISVTGGMGQTTLDLSGRWGAGSVLSVKMTAGGLTLRIPRSLGVRVRSEQFLSSFPSRGWNSSNGALLSPGYASASQHVDLSLETALGSVNVEWMGPP